LARISTQERILNSLERCRSQSLQLVSGLTSHEMSIQVDELRGPLIWDLGHCAWFEELWILRKAFQEAASHDWSDTVYDNERNHKRSRQTMKLLRQEDLLHYMQDIRQRVLAQLEKADLSTDDPLFSNGFVFDLVLNHEMQHREVMIITLQQLLSFPLPAMEHSEPWSIQEADRHTYSPGEMVEIPAGAFMMGATHESFAYDNERPAHQVHVASFALDRFLTSNEDYLEFIEAGGYERRELWSDEGWQWIKFNQIFCPDFWRFDPHKGWVHKNFGGDVRPLDPEAPVCNISFHEADAYARFRDKRLPTEAEWEKAAAWDPDSQQSRRFPWGSNEFRPELANLNTSRWSPAKVWEYAAGESHYGVRQMIGSVFEWTATPFAAYPEFKAFPYKEYSEIFMNPQVKVLRGASWATDPESVRNSYRNFYLAHQRNVIAGVRLAKSLE